MLVMGFGATAALVAAVLTGSVVWLVGLNPGVLEMVRNSALYERLGRDRLLFNARAAIERYQAQQTATS